MCLMKVVFPVEYWPNSMTIGLASKSLEVYKERQVLLHYCILNQGMQEQFFNLPEKGTQNHWNDK